MLTWSMADEPTPAKSAAGRLLRSARADRINAALAAGEPIPTRTDAAAAGVELTPVTGHTLGGYRRMGALTKEARRKLAQQGGLRGSAMLSAPQRKQRASRAAYARWAKWRKEHRKKPA